MIDIVFSTLNTGACPMCKKRSDCRIIESIKKTAYEVVREKYDNQMEIVIYRCPEFYEKS